MPSGTSIPTDNLQEGRKILDSGSGSKAKELSLNRKHSPEHDFWHSRVEGQIKDVMRAHPEYFNADANQKTVLNSIAKRVVGEIVQAMKEKDWKL
jgi:hypothetical protein